jgi:hypothetical protein
MKLTKKKSLRKTTAKLLFAGVLSFGIMGFTATAFSQAPPPPPPPGEFFKKINPFKKKKSAPARSNGLKLPARPAAPGNGPGTPPTPPNPIEAIKKIKLPKPPPHPGT